MFTETVSYQAALIAGLLSFFSPCILPLIPAYFTFITGLSVEELTRDTARIRTKVIVSTLAYVAGFSFVFILLGASASFAGALISRYAGIIQYIGGGIILIFGIHLLGIINIKGLNFEKRVHMKQKPLHIAGIFLVGMAFGAGWSPCIGPMLGSILIVASNQETVINGIVLLGIYSLGLAVPFLLMSFFVHKIFDILKRANKALVYINRISGVLLVVLGLLLIFDKFRILGTL